MVSKRVSPKTLWITKLIGYIVIICILVILVLDCQGVIVVVTEEILLCQWISITVILVVFVFFIDMVTGYPDDWP